MVYGYSAKGAHPSPPQVLVSTNVTFLVFAHGVAASIALIFSEAALHCKVSSLRYGGQKFNGKLISLNWRDMYIWVFSPYNLCMQLDRCAFTKLGR